MTGQPDYTEILRARIKREVGQILDRFDLAYEESGCAVTVLRLKKPPTAWQTIHDIAKAEWEKQPGEPRIEWVDTKIN